MLTCITMENFKSYHKAELPLAALTLLIGANASGKSNAIEALRFLSLLAQGRRLDDIFRSVQREDVAVRGTMRDLTYDGADTLTLGCSLSNTEPWTHFRISLGVEESGMRIIEERIFGEHSTVPLYELKHPAQGFSHEVQVAYNNFARGGRKPTIPCTDQQAIFTQLETTSRFNPGEARQVIPEVAGKLQQALQGTLFLDPNPSRMRMYSFITDNILRDDGTNLSAVLYDLCEVNHQKERILQFIRHLPEQDIQDIRFLETPRREVMLQLVETFAGREQERDAPVLSDGTLRVLSVAAALLSAAPGSLVVIEEIDNGVHPSRVGELLSNIQEIAKTRELRVLLTSHNPALFDALPMEAVPDVVSCYRDPQKGDSRLQRFESLADYPELVTLGPLGQLMTKGTLERALKSQVTPEMRKASARKWLENLKAEIESG
ncbi:MAG: hypothetical protein ETSY1_04465 [Candidatus Entotheonella factor]|uniref:ATPase n=1 Tax=Entotheonella factor TaxID=1429438 RepID=W4LWQ0_ENTF1|nr:AAA family ATPase [Candidatus Entotheonella palauensis]ETX02196.1 MAG: hypothetical protein ETSY1_04465 [Candidatus Entotheonella factor]